LHDAGDDLLGGIFDGDDVPAALFGKVPKARIDSGGFSAAGGTSQKQQAEGLTEKPFQFQTRCSGEIQFSKSFDGGAVEQAKNDFFTGDGWIGRHAKIVARLNAGFVNAPILWKRFLVRFEPRQKFDPANDSFSQFRWQLTRPSHYTIEAKGNAGRSRPHLQMNIACLRLFRLLDQAFQNQRSRLL